MDKPYKTEDLDSIINLLMEAYGKLPPGNSQNPAERITVEVKVGHRDLIGEMFALSICRES